MLISEHDTTEYLPGQAGLPATNGLSWFAVATRPRFEKKVTAELRKKGTEVFLPSHASVRQWSDRRRLIQLPLFPGYVFVKVIGMSSMRIPILRTDGVLSFVGLRGIGTPIPDNEIEAIRALLKNKIPFDSCPFLQIGQRVRIRGGSLDGLEGNLTAVRGDQSLIISVELIQRSVAMRVSGYQVEPV